MERESCVTTNTGEYGLALLALVLLWGFVASAGAAITDDDIRNVLT